MSRSVRLLIVVALVTVLLPTVGLAQGGPAPAPPGTGPLSVQMFIGGTEYTYLSVYPPTAFTDGSAIPSGTTVQVRVYRWTRGAGWAAVQTPAGEGPWGSGGQGTVDQSFINMVAVTPVDCAPPRVVVLGITAVVNGVESPIVNTTNLTFRYAAEPPPENPSQCVPLLVRYATPGEVLAADQIPPVNSAPPGAAAAPPEPTSTEPDPVGLPPAAEPPAPVAPSGPPRIDSVKPTVGAVTRAEAAVAGALRNMQVAVLGANFDPINPEQNRVTIGGVEATILGILSNEIRIEVPAGTVSGPVQVTVGSQASNEVDFTVTTVYANAVMSEDVRFGREWLPDLLQAVLGAPDHDGPAGEGTPGTALGTGNGGSFTLDLGEGQEVYNGPGNDLVVYERGGGTDQSLANEGYEVLVSDSPDSGFVSLGSAYGVDRGVGDGFDLSRGGVTSARYVRIVDDGDGTTVNGVDIDAVEVVSVSAPPAEPAGAGALDLIFVIDLTESMIDDIANVKATAVDILNAMAAEFPDHRVAILGYRDWEDAVMFEDYPFSSDQDAIVDNINALSVSGGGDWPEAVLEALLRAIDCTTLGGWRSGVEKHIIVMGDAPPHDPIAQGPDAGKTTDDVDWAAKRADPVVIHTIVIRFDESTRVAFEKLSAGSGGSTALAERAEDVPNAILGTIGEIAGTSAAAVEPVTTTVELEDNNSFGTANSILASGTITGAIDPARDSDWYGLAVPTGGELRVTITQVAPELDLVYRVWNANLETISDWVRPLALGGDTDGYVDLPAAGRYVVEVRDGSDDAASSQAYLVTTSFMPMVDTGEPNASIGPATPLALGTTIRANILPRRDHDFYRLDIPGRSELHVVIDEVSADLDLVFRVWNAERETITDWYAPLRAGAPTEGYVDFAAAGTYFLEVADGSDDQRSAQPYALTTALVPVVDAAESNDSFGRAESIAIGQPVQGTILPRRDHDWYRIEVPGRAELHVLISNVAPELDMIFRVWDGNRNAITDWYAPLRAGADNEAYVDFPAAGTYYLEVADSRDDQRSTQPYLLETSIIVTPDSLLSNDNFGRAEPIQLGQLASGSILPVRDHDWYSVAVPTQGQMQVEITNVPPNLEVVFRVWDRERRTITDWQAPLRAGGDTIGLAEIAVAGTYYIEVADSRDDARSPLPYTLQATMGGS